MEYLILGAHQKNLAFAYPGWEVLDLFDFEISKSNISLYYDPETREIYLTKKGMYKFEFFAQLFADTEDGVGTRFRLDIDGTPLITEFYTLTETDQRFEQTISLDGTQVVRIEVNAAPAGTPVISNSGNDRLIITKII